MKIALINDIHGGIRNDAIFMIEHQKRFFENIFFPELEKNNINTVLIGGDLFDRRKYINFNTLNHWKKFFFKELQKRNITVHIIPGNHDVVYKSTNEVNSLQELLYGYSNIIIHDDPVTLNFAESSIDFIPWINNQNYPEIAKYMQNSKAEFCYGHFEIKGYEMYRGVKNDHGMAPDFFSKYKEVWSGHFHCKSEKDNIKYLGAPMEFTFADCGDARGFHIFDCSKKDLTFIPNTYTLFEKLYYDDSSDCKQEKIKQFDFSKLEDKIVKLYVTKKTFPALFENFVDNLIEVKNIILTIQEDFSEFHSDNVENIEKYTTKELMEEYVDNVQTDMDKSRLKSILNNTYIEALHSEV